MKGTIIGAIVLGILAITIATGVTLTKQNQDLRSRATNTCDTPVINAPVNGSSMAPGFLDVRWTGNSPTGYTVQVLPNGQPCPPAEPACVDSSSASNGPSIGGFISFNMPSQPPSSWNNYKVVITNLCGANPSAESTVFLNSSLARYTLSYYTYIDAVGPNLYPGNQAVIRLTDSTGHSTDLNSTNGLAMFSNLIPGTYTGSFVTAPPGYHLTSTGSFTDTLTSNVTHSFVIAQLLTATCSVTPTSISTGQNVRWFASATGGDGNYTYNWEFQDSDGRALLLEGQVIPRTYYTAGNQNAVVVVNSAGEHLATQCPVLPVSMSCPAAQSCPTTCHVAAVDVPNGSCGQTSCPGNAPAAADPPPCRTTGGSVPDGNCGTTNYAANCTTSCNGNVCTPPIGGICETPVITSPQNGSRMTPGPVNVSWTGNSPNGYRVEVLPNGQTCPATEPACVDSSSSSNGASNGGFVSFNMPTTPPSSWTNYKVRVTNLCGANPFAESTVSLSTSSNGCNPSCGAGQICLGGQCICSTVGPSCAQGFHPASLPFPTCWTCQPDSPCGGSCGGTTPVCDTTTNTCVQCLSNTNCGTNQSCSANHVCVANPFDGCDSTHPCQTGQYCANATCRTIPPVATKPEITTACPFYSGSKIQWSGVPYLASTQLGDGFFVDVSTVPDFGGPTTPNFWNKFIPKGTNTSAVFATDLTSFARFAEANNTPIPTTTGTTLYTRVMNGNYNGQLNWSNTTSFTVPDCNPLPPPGQGSNPTVADFCASGGLGANISWTDRTVQTLQIATSATPVSNDWWTKDNLSGLNQTDATGFVKNGSTLALDFNRQYYIRSIVPGTFGPGNWLPFTTKPQSFCNSSAGRVGFCGLSASEAANLDGNGRIPVSIGYGGTNGRVRLLIQKRAGGPISDTSQFSPVPVNEPSYAGQFTYLLDSFQPSLSQTSKNINLTLPNDEFNIFCDSYSQNTSFDNPLANACSGNPSCSYGTNGSCSGSNSNERWINRCDNSTGSDNFTTHRLTVASASPSQSPIGACTAIQNCTLGTLSGSMFCEGTQPSGGSCSKDKISQCWSDETKNSAFANYCGIAPSTLGLTCQPIRNDLPVGQSTAWEIKFNGSAGALGPGAAITFTPDGGSSTTPQSPRAIYTNGNYVATTTPITYTNQGTYAPKLKVVFGTTAVITPNEIQCSPLTVGKSSLSATVSGPTSLSTGTEGSFNVRVSDSTADPNTSISQVTAYVIKTNGAIPTAAECGKPLTNGRCQVLYQSGLSGSKDANFSFKWKPGGKTADYQVYVDAISTNASSHTNLSCTGKRPSQSNVITAGQTIYPCGNDAAQDIHVDLTAAIDGFKIAESQDGLATAPWVPITRYPYLQHYQFTDNTPGVKTIFVQFRANIGTPQPVFQKSIKLVSPDPIITNAACNLDISGKGLTINLTGYNFGNKDQSALVSANGNNAQITSWTNNAASRKADVVTSKLTNAGIDPQNGQSYNIVLTRPDGQKAEATCQVGVSNLSIGAKSLCRAASAFDQDNVDVVIADGFKGGKVVRQKVKIDKDGTITGLNTVLQKDSCYKISIKAPKSVRRDAEFQAGEGTTVLPDFHLPIGDIFPAGGDGVINSNDRAEIIRQWNAGALSAGGATGSATINKPTTSRTGDFNQDGIINTFDFSCMIFDFNASNDSEPTPGPLSNTVLQKQCDDAQTTSSKQGSDEIILGEPASPNSSAANATPRPSSTTIPGPSGSGGATIPASPTLTLVSATKVAENTKRVTLSWTKVPNTVKYNLYQKTGDNAIYDPAAIAYVNPNSNSLTHTFGVSATTKYTFKIKACQTADLCSESNEITVPANKDT